MEIPSVPSENGRSTVIFYNRFYYYYSITKCALLQIVSQGVEQSYSEIAHLVIMISSIAPLISSPWPIIACFHRESIVGGRRQGKNCWSTRSFLITGDKFCKKLIILLRQLALREIRGVSTAYGNHTFCGRELSSQNWQGLLGTG